MTDLRIQRTTARGHAPDVPLPRPRQPTDQPPVEPPDAVGEAVELSRLLRLAGLSPAQAVEVGAGLLEAVAARTDPDTGGDQVVIGTVVIGADGRVALRPGSDRRDGDEPPAGRPTGVAVGALLADVARAARSRTGRTGPEADPLLAELDRAVAEVPVTGVPAVARTLGALAAGIDRRAVRAELGALARTIDRRTAQPYGGGPVRVPSTAVRPGATRRPATQEKRIARRRIGAWLLSILVLSGVVLLENAFLRDKVTADVGVLLDAGRSGSTPAARSTAPKPDGRPVVPPAPAAAGSVRGVDLRPLDGCSPGAPCTVRLLIRVTPAAGPQVVTWSYRVVDRCTGAVTPTPGGSLSIPAGGDRVAVVATVPLPTAPAVGVVAVTAVPAVAASAPLLVGSCGPATG